MAQPTTPHPQQHQQMPGTPGVGQTGQQPGYPQGQAAALPPGTLAATAQQAAQSRLQAQAGSVGQMAPPPPGIASQAVQTPTTEGAKPVLFDDIDPVLLCRLYPNSKSGDEARGLAEKAGADAHDAGLKLVASQQEPPLEMPPPT